MDLTKEFQDYGGQGTVIPQDSSLLRLRGLAEEQLQLEAEIANLEEQLKEKNKALDQVRDQRLPDLMAELGVRDFTLTSGDRVKVSALIFASITKERAEDCFSWLEKNGFGGIVKSEVRVETGKGAEEKVAALVAAAREMGLTARAQRSVHPATLKAFVGEQLEKGSQLPMDLFGVYTINRVKITTSQNL